MSVMYDERQMEWCCMPILHRDNIGVTKLCKFPTVAIVLMSLVDCPVRRF